MSDAEDTKQGYTYFEHGDACFRRGPHGRKQVDDILHDGVWIPYDGDCLEPALFGDEIDDPLAGAA
jgi:hypothetical protein